MPQSLAAVYLHLVFSTKDRHPSLHDPELRSDMHAFLAGITKRIGCLPLEIGGVADHVHLLAGLSRTVTVADWVRDAKSNSSAWIRQKGYRNFAWQQGYAVFSVETDGLAGVREYIRSQEVHHNGIDFREEFLRLLREHDLQWDERYIWD